MKKVLIITYYWPPAGGPGVQRWLKFVKYLPEFGVEPVLFIPQNPDYPLVDESLLAEVPTDLKIIEKPIFEPYRLASFFSKKNTQNFSSGIIAEEKNQSKLQKLLLYIRGNFFIPDARKFWIKPSINYLNTFLQEEKIDQIITTGPPHSLHLIGLGLKQRLNLTWIADFRDPWTQIGYHKRLKLSQKSQQKHQELEQKVLAEADAIITTSYTTKEEFNVLTSKPIHVITNGFDTFPKKEKATRNTVFTLSHIGNLLSGRNPLVLWEALSELTEENPDFKKHFKLQLIGRISNEVHQALTNQNLKPYTEIPGYVSHSEAQNYQQQADILLLIEVDNRKNRGIIPGKLFEYLQAQKTIVALGPKKWDVPQIIDETKSGFSFEYDEKARLKETLLKLFKEFQKGTLTCSSQNIQKYHRKQLTKTLSSVIKNL